MSRRVFVDIVTSLAPVEKRTKGTPCSNCNGYGKIRGYTKSGALSKVQKICKECNGVGVKYQKLSDLSKGWRQRAWLGQSLIHNPDILFLDEPTDGFDPIQKVAIRNHIKTLSKGKIILMSTHILEEAEAICDRVLIINSGRLVKDGPTSSFVDKKGRLEETIRVFAS